MRAAPPVSVSVRPGGAGRRAVLLLAALAAIALSAWAWQRADAIGLAAVLLLAAYLAWLLVLETRRPALCLRSDGNAWWLGVQGAQAEPVAGDVAVAFDLGDWLLLDFRPHPGQGPTPGRWLSLQRSALEADWHALRCAVHAPVAQRR